MEFFVEEQVRQREDQDWKKKKIHVKISPMMHR